MSSDFKKSDGEYRLSTGQTLFYSCHPEIQAGGCGVGLHPDRNPVSGIIISARDRSNTRSLFLVFIGSFQISLPGEDGRRVLMLRLNFDFLVDSSGGAASVQNCCKILRKPPPLGSTTERTFNTEAQDQRTWFRRFAVEGRSWPGRTTPVVSASTSLGFRIDHIQRKAKWNYGQGVYLGMPSFFVLIILRGMC